MSGLFIYITLELAGPFRVAEFGVRLFENVVMIPGIQPDPRWHLDDPRRRKWHFSLPRLVFWVPIFSFFCIVYYYPTPFGEIRYGFPLTYLIDVSDLLGEPADTFPFVIDLLFGAAIGVLVELLVATLMRIVPVRRNPTLA